MELDHHARGLLRGLATGDALGLPREGLSPRRARRRFGTVLRHRFVLGRGVISDDTEHAFMTGQALLASRLDPARFARALAWRLRGWSAGLPAGVGWATLRACARLWVGISPHRSGVWSAGNGPLMRAPVIGFAIVDPARRRRLIEISTRITHTDPLALEAAHAIAEASAAARAGVTSVGELLGAARMPLVDDRWAAPLARLVAALADDASPATWAAAEGLGGGVTGYVLHTLPAVLYVWLRDPRDWAGTVRRALDLGGDTDTVAAIAGALAGTVGGADRVTPALVAGICDAPLTIARLDRLAVALAATVRDEATGPIAMPWRLLQPIRNLIVLAIVLGHGVRRMIPPW